MSVPNLPTPVFFSSVAQFVGSQFPDQELNLSHSSESLESYPLGSPPLF